MADQLCFRYDFPASAGELANMRHALERSLLALELDEQTIKQLVLAANEAAMNVIQHAYHGEEGDMLLQVHREGNQLVFTLDDSAPKTDPAKVRGRKLEDVRPGGLGVHFMHSIMDSIEFMECPDHAGNRLIMIKKL